MIRSRGVALSREKLITEVWGYDYYGDSNIVNTHIKNIRQVYDDFVPVTTKYDLIGSIATDTGLTRHTIIEILKNK